MKPQAIASTGVNVEDTLKVPGAPKTIKRPCFWMFLVPKNLAVFWDENHEENKCFVVGFWGENLFWILVLQGSRAPSSKISTRKAAGPIYLTGETGLLSRPICTVSLGIQRLFLWFLHVLTRKTNK